MKGKNGNADRTTRLEPGVSGLRQRGVGSPLLSLVWLQFKVAVGLRRISASFGLADKHRKYAGIILLLLTVSFIPWIATMYDLGRALAAAAVDLNQPGLPIVLEVTAAQFFVFFMTITHLMSTLFYAEDVETLKAMPLRAHHIVLAKIAVVYVIQLVISLVPAAPFVVALGLRLRDASYWPFAILTHLFVPGLPVAVALIGVLALMRLTGFSARRDLIRVILGLVFFALIMGFQAVYIRAGIGLETAGPEAILNLISQRQGLITAMTKCYPPARWAAMAVTGETLVERLGNLLLLAGFSVVALVLIARVTESWFVAGEKREARARGARAGWSHTAQRVIETEHSPMTAVMLRDVRILVRTPNFLLTALMNLLVFPLILLMSFVVSRSGAGTALLSLETLRHAPFVDLAGLAVVGIHGLIAGLNQIPSAAISREGRMFWVSKAIPVEPATQLRAKMAYSIVYGLLQSLIVVVITVLLLKLPVTTTVWVTILCIAVLWPLGAIGLLVDLLRPKLDWTEPQQAMKGNFGTLLAGLVSAGYVIGLGFGVKYLYDRGVPGSLLYPAVLAVLLLTGAGLESWLERWGTVRYREIEV
ncbi:MAG: hypothetical protein IMW97_05315 [Firmicutes bacterium]|nr:hypothetical protein [Candidatus Fermentithermobacillaceae bacterium]